MYNVETGVVEFYQDTVIIKPEKQIPAEALS